MAKAKINGFAYSMASHRFTVFGLRVPLKEFNHKHAVDREEVRNNSRKPDAYTAGDWKGECSFTVLRSVWDQIQAHTLSSRGTAVMDTKGDVVVTRSERGLPSGTIQVSVAGLSESDESLAAGPAAAVVKITCNVLDILENGKSLISDEEDY